MKKVKILSIILAASALLSSCGTLKESYKTENGITIHTIGSGSHSQAYLIVKQTVK
jgi:ABC-type molybdate transport system substrate-binding protein